MGTPAAIVDATIGFLKAYEPFARMARRDLEFVAGRARLAYFPAGAVVLRGADAAAEARPPLHVIQRGHVKRFDPDSRRELILGPGECFPVPGLAPEPAPAADFAATEDVFCYLLAPEDVATLRARSAPFADYCAAALASVLRRSLGELHRWFGERAAEQQTLLQTVGALVRRAPVCCSGHTPLHRALAQMSEARVGTIAVVDAAGRPVGIFTLTDLLDRVVLAARPLDTPVATVMTPSPGAIDAAATAQEALALMAARGFHQLMVTRGAELVGVVSERDLFALQRVSMRHVLDGIRTARDVPALARAAQEIGVLTENLLAQGAAAEPLTHTIASLHDALARRLFELLVPRFDLAGLAWCWLALGSEGRREQTIVTDQDNALVFRAARADREFARRRLTAFGAAVNAALAELGVPLCSGNVMAGNPDCCLALEEWRARFGGWLREPTPAALLAANIWFDLRPLAGDASLADALRGWIADTAREARLFLRLLAQNALQCEPPLGVIRTFRTDEDEAHPGTLDLKVQGTRLFVDAARALALGCGIAETGTAQRLRLAGRRLGADERAIEAWVEAFHFLQLLRLRVQRGALDADGAAVRRPHNRLDPYALNELDQRMLRESFRQARALQLLLERSFGQ